MIQGAVEPMVELVPNATSGADVLRSAVVSLQAERGAELWGLARHLGLSPEEADDAVQETLLRLWSALRIRWHRPAGGRPHRHRRHASLQRRECPQHTERSLTASRASSAP